MFEYDDDSIIARNGYMVIIRWENHYENDHIQRGNTGDILEVGYGMGICNVISYNICIKTTIVEKDPEVFEKLQDWSKDKP